ncbi:MAG: salicylate 1-monooxygenase [Paraburkholderia sp.]|nr:MAG: salicylate 1-monooxygenase [Paraburkholderia sp.]
MRSSRGELAQVRVAVIGAGIGGTAMAALVQRFGCEVAVYEQYERFAPAGGGIHLSPNLMRVLRHLDVHRHVMMKGQEPRAFLNRDAVTGEMIYALALGECGYRRFGAPFIALRRGELQTALMSAVTPGSVRWGKRLAGLDWRGETIVLSFDDGSRADADIVIAADGLRSRVRSILRGNEQPVFAGQVAFRGSYPRQGLGDLHVDDLTKWWGDDTFVLSYWLDRAQRDFYFAAMIPQSTWATEASFEPADLDEMRRAFELCHPDIRKMLAGAPAGSVMKWALFERPPCFEFGTGRVVLIGDACHPMRPFMSQGAAMALEDAVTLTRAIQGHGDFERAAQVFADARRERLTRVHRVSAANTFMRRDLDPQWVFGYDALGAHETAQLPALRAAPAMAA